MKIILLCSGKIDLDYISKGIEVYSKRITYYTSFEIKYTQATKNTKNQSAEQIKNKESLQLLSLVNDSDYVILLDETGKEYTSQTFATYLSKKMSTGIKQLVFIIGGAYGFSNELYKRTNEMISLSKMTFPHQLVRLVFVEQLYRAFTIIKGEKYHH